MPSLCFSSDSPMLASVELGSGPVADVLVTDLADGQLSIELAGSDGTGVLLIGTPDAVVGLITEAARALSQRHRGR